MYEFLKQEILNNTVRDYLLVFITILLALILKRLMSRYIAGLLFKAIHRMAKGVDKRSFINLVVSPLETFLLLLITIVSIDELTFPKVLNFNLYKLNMHDLLEGISTIVLIVTFIWLLLRIIDFVVIIIRQKGDHALTPANTQLLVFFKDFFKVMLIIISFLMILKMAFHYRISNFITALSIGSAALALSFRESLENLIASFIIFFDKPFVTGDQVTVQNITGVVEKIGLRSTRIRSDQKTYVTVPNKQMVDSIMNNLTLRTQLRAFVQLELDAGTPHDLVNRFVLRVQQVLSERKEKIETYTVFLADISKNAFVLNVEFFTAPIPADEFNSTRQEINLAMIALLEELKIKLTMPLSLQAKIP